MYAKPRTSDVAGALGGVVVLCLVAYYGSHYNNAPKRPPINAECPDGTEPAGLAPPAGRATWCELVGERGDRERHGPFKSWYPNGAVAEIGTYEHGKKSGTWWSWLPDGKRKDITEHGKSDPWWFWFVAGEHKDITKSNAGVRMDESGAPSVVHVVREGESLWDIARAYGVTVEAIQQASGLDERQMRRLSKGAQLRIPGASRVIDVLAKKAEQPNAATLPPLSDGAYHKLAAGESLWTIARTYDVPIDTLLKRNKLSADTMGSLRIGQAIIVPGVSQSQIKAAEPSETPKGFSHEMLPGETIWDLAHTYGVAVSEIMAANSLSADEAANLSDGKRLFIPGVELRDGHVRRTATARERRAQVIAEQLGLGSLSAAGALLHGRVEARWIQAADRIGRFPGTLLWPIHNGVFVRGYGSGQGGYHKAMDIMGKMGWNVRAAAPGIVGYVGDKVSGFGNMIMVVHASGWVTLYAHNSVNFVAAGQNVNRGDILAEVGGVHVHFELIQGGRSCDPAPLMRPGVLRHDGKIENIQYATWTRPDQRPEQIKCSPRPAERETQWVLNEDPKRDAVPDLPAAGIDLPAGDEAP